MYRVNRFSGSKSWMERVHVALVCVCIAGAALGASGGGPDGGAKGGTGPTATGTAGDRETTVFYDAQVFTAEPDHPYADAVAIRGNRILAVGDLAAVAEAAGPSARKVDLKGGFLMPGMIDGHAHPIAGGVTLIQANYPDTQDSIPNLTQFVAEHVKKKDSRLGDVLVVNGIDIGYWAHAAEIDASLPAPSAETMLEAGEAAVHYMNGLGITGWLDAAVSGVVGGAVPASVEEPGFLPVYQALSQCGELTAHVVAYPVVKPDLGNRQIDVVEALRAKYGAIPNLTIPGLKVFADGVVEIPSQTAALTKRYVNTGRSGELLFTPAKMNALVTEAAKRGLNVHIHAIGDLAVKASLDAFQAARQAYPAANLPFSLTHAQFVDPEDVPRFAQLHVIAALQLLWAVADPSTNEQVKPYIDPSIYRWMYPARSMLDSGAVIAGASDWPVSTIVYGHEP